MNEEIQDNDNLQSEPAEQDLVVMIKKMQQQLTFLEKKIDILINQSEARPSGEKAYSKPFRPFNNQNRRPDRGHEGHSGPRNYYSERSSESRHGGHPFKGHQGGRKKSFGDKKPFYFKRRDRG
jgi:hypothetical protein